MRRPDPRKLVRDMNRARPKKENVPSFKHKNIPELVEIVPPRATVERFAAIFSAEKVTNWRVQTFTLGECSIILTKEYGLLHVSISHAARYPTWDEIAAARYRLIPADRDAIMVLPPVDEYINHHEFCFHVHETAPGSLDAALNLPTRKADDASDPDSSQ
jgi:hypothetical protein